MEVQKIKSGFGYDDIVLIQDNLKLKIELGFNGDLYWYIQYSEKQENKVTFEISKKESEMYNIFSELYEIIKNREIYKVNSYELEFCETEEEKKELYERKRNLNENASVYINYNLLFQDKTISWHSDSTIYDEANIVNISKTEEKIILEFILYNKDMADEDSIRFSNSGSRYKPFNLVFMEMFQKLQQINLSYNKQEESKQKKIRRL